MGAATRPPGPASCRMRRGRRRRGRPRVGRCSGRRRHGCRRSALRWRATARGRALRGRAPYGRAPCHAIARTRRGGGGGRRWQRAKPPRDYLVEEVGPRPAAAEPRPLGHSPWHGHRSTLAETDEKNTRLCIGRCGCVYKERGSSIWPLWPPPRRCQGCWRWVVVRFCRFSDESLCSVFDRCR